MRKFYFLFLLVIGFSNAFSQSREVSGTVQDSTGMTVIGAAVKLTSAQDTLSSVTDIDGKFRFRNLKSAEGQVTINALGYKPYVRGYQFKEQGDSLTLSTIQLTNDSRLLKEVIVDGTPEVVVKEDTLQYRADAYKLKENALAEDLLKKLPGVEVDRDGNVTAQGKQVTKIRVNGKDFFGGDVKTATQQLPADLLENVQVIDDYGDQANLTGIKDGEPEKILNFTIRPDRNKGFLTRGTVGAGNQDRYQASVFGASFNNDQQVSVLANLNNTNANIFSLTNTGGGGRRQRGGGGSAGGSGEGLTDVKSIGLNYRDDLSKKVTVYGSYSLADNDNNVLNQLFQQTLVGNRSNITNEFSNGNTDNLQHRFDFNLEYKIDSSNYLKISPRFNYSRSDNAENSTFSIDTSNVRFSEGNFTDLNTSKSPNFSTNLLFNHRFGNTTRNLSLNADVSSSSNTNNQNYENFNYLNGNTSELQYQHQLIENNNDNNSLGLRLSYNEPLSKTAGLEFNYSYDYSKTQNSREVLNTTDQDIAPWRDENLSNDYEFKFITNRFGLNYRVREAKYNYTVGFGVQPTVLTGFSSSIGEINTRAVNIFPSGRFQYKFSRTRELNIDYRGRSNQPTYSQLQPVTDNSNPQNPIIGNPNLNAEFNSSVNVRYNNFDPQKGNVLFTNLSYSFSNDRIVTNTINIDRTLYPDTTAIQSTEYLNADGYYTLNGFYAFSRSFADKKYVLGLRGMANYNNLISFIDGEKNTGRNVILSQRLQLQVQPNDWLEVVPAVSYTYNQNKNSLNERFDTRVNTWSLSFDSKIYFTPTFLIGTQADKSFNSGYNNIGANPFIINTYLEKQFFKGKTGALRFTAFDILDENTSISRTVNPGMTIDRRSNRLSRYFMLTFTMRINKFSGSGNPSSFGSEEGGRRFRGNGPGGGGPRD